MMIIPAVYGPGTGFISQLRGQEEISIQAGLLFEKGGSFNRMRILAAGGPLLLSIPVRKSPKDTPLSEIRIDYIQKWQNQHWRSLFSAYGKSPFFGYYRKELEELFLKQTDLLVEFNASILAWTIRQYYPKMRIQANLSAGDRIAEQLVELPPDTDQKSGQFRYRQVFGSDFVSGLGILDHLFCAGPSSLW